MTVSAFSQNYSLILGGSFNPLHIGHLRIAIEVQQAMRPEEFYFLPCASPPHKPGHCLLSFDLRRQMLEETLQAYPFFSINTIEQEREAPSYSVDTLMLLQARYPHKRFGFILGSSEICALPTWQQWEKFLTLTDLIVLPRNDTLSNFKKTVRRICPDAHEIVPMYPFQAVFQLQSDRKIYYLDQPQLPISSSMIREYWCSGRNIDFLVPNRVLKKLIVNADLVQALWCHHPRPCQISLLRRTF